MSTVGNNTARFSTLARSKRLKASGFSEAKAETIVEVFDSKIEKQTDMYLSTLRSYVEAMGGELDVVVRLPDREPVKVKSLEDVVGSLGITVGTD